MQIECEKCKAVAETVLPETYLDGEIEFTFFRCQECGEIYPVCATDAALRADIAEYTRMRDIIRKKPVTEQFLRKVQALKERNVKRSKELAEQHPLVSFLQQLFPMEETAE